jgi:hypothetical protein
MEKKALSYKKCARKTLMKLTTANVGDVFVSDEYNYPQAYFLQSLNGTRK